MLRWLLVFGLILLATAFLLGSGWLPPALQAALGWAFNVAVYVLVPIFLVMFLMAPGLFPSLSNEAKSLWQRLRGGETADLRRKIDTLDKPHHMVQLGNVYLHAARYAKAEPWFARALEREPESLEARYKTGLCRFHASDFAAAKELLEAVHAEKPDYDYGMAYLRLAQTHSHLGNHERAAEVFDTMLKFYPGHAEASYSYGIMLAETGDWNAAAGHIRNVNATLKHAPPFQRRRNRHWALKSWWWLFRHGKRANGSSHSLPDTQPTSRDQQQPQDESAESKTPNDTASSRDHSIAE